MLHCSCPGIIYVGALTLRETHRLIADSFALVSTAIKPKSCTPVLEVRYGTVWVSVIIDQPLLLDKPPGHDTPFFAALRGSVRVRACLVGRIGSGVRLMPVFEKHSRRPLRQQKGCYNLAGLSGGGRLISNQCLNSRKRAAVSARRT